MEPISKQRKMSLEESSIDFAFPPNSGFSGSGNSNIAPVQEDPGLGKGGYQDNDNNDAVEGIIEPEVKQDKEDHKIKIESQVICRKRGTDQKRGIALGTIPKISFVLDGKEYSDWYVAPRFEEISGRKGLKKSGVKLQEHPSLFLELCAFQDDDGNPVVKDQKAMLRQINRTAFSKHFEIVSKVEHEAEGGILPADGSVADPAKMLSKIASNSENKEVIDHAKKVIEQCRGKENWKELMIAFGKEEWFFGVMTPYLVDEALKQMSDDDFFLCFPSNMDMGEICLVTKTWKRSTFKKNDVQAEIEKRRLKGWTRGESGMFPVENAERLRQKLVDIAEQSTYAKDYINIMDNQWPLYSRDKEKLLMLEKVVDQPWFYGFIRKDCTVEIEKRMRKREKSGRFCVYCSTKEHGQLTLLIVNEAEVKGYHCGSWSDLETKLHGVDRAKQGISRGQSTLFRYHK